MLKVNWNCGSMLSPLHAIERLAKTGRLTDQKLDAAIRESVTQIMDRLTLAEVDAHLFWPRFMRAGSETLSDQSRVQSALLNAGCSEWSLDTSASAILRRISDARAAMQDLYPRLEDQLALRARPLKEQWETVGPGLMKLVGKRTHPDLIPNRLTLFFVHPATGGFAAAVPEERWGWVEAVLTNGVPGIPEVVRVGWVLTSIALGHSLSNRLVPPERLPWLGGLAAVPIVLKAAAELELVEDTPKLLTKAADAWGIEMPVEIILRWWDQQSTANVPFAVGLKALDRMLESP